MLPMLRLACAFDRADRTSFGRRCGFPVTPFSRDLAYSSPATCTGEAVAPSGSIRSGRKRPREKTLRKRRYGKDVGNEKIMKKILLTTAVFAALGMAPVMAADLAARPYTKAPPPAPVLNWTGFFIGAEGG